MAHRRPCFHRSLKSRRQEANQVKLHQTEASFGPLWSCRSSGGRFVFLVDTALINAQLDSEIVENIKIQQRICQISLLHLSPLHLHTAARITWKYIEKDRWVIHKEDFISENILVHSYLLILVPWSHRLMPTVLILFMCARVPPTFPPPLSQVVLRESGRL